MIYKICPASAWREAERQGVYRGSADDARDGFIHFSTASQVAETAKKHFFGQTGLFLIAVDADKLGEALRSIPRDAWPYGRVAAVEEAHKIPEGGRPQVRRTMEATMKTLGDLGIVVYEWNENGPGLK